MNVHRILVIPMQPVRTPWVLTSVIVSLDFLEMGRIALVSTELQFFSLCCSTDFMNINFSTSRYQRVSKRVMSSKCHLCGFPWIVQLSL